MLKPRYSNQFKKDYKLAIKRGKDESLFIEVLEKLIKQEPLPAKNKDHQFSGNWAKHRECHIQPDWLTRRFVWKIKITLKIFKIYYKYEKFYKPIFSRQCE